MTGKVVVLGTGGTIASRADDADVRTARDAVAALVARAPISGDVRVESRDVMCVGSYLLTLEQMAEIVRQVRNALDDPAVRGVVVTHGTDTLEETAFLADLVHRDDRPVVFTGAQRTPDEPHADGPRNLADAIAVANADAARGSGALIVFAGRVFRAPGTRKVHTSDVSAFCSPGVPPAGTVDTDGARIERPARRSDTLDLDTMDLSGVRVDIVTYYPGAASTLLRAAAGAGATGIVVEATGAGNANPEFCRAIADLSSAGVVVALTTRVPAGPVVARYGAGGGADLVRAGAIPSGTLRAAQTRILQAALLAAYHDPRRVAAELRKRCAI